MAAEAWESESRLTPEFLPEFGELRLDGGSDDSGVWLDDGCVGVRESFTEKLAGVSDGV